MEQLKDFIIILGLSLLMGFSVFMVGFLHLENNMLLLFSQVAMGVVLYIFLCSLAKISSFIEIRSMAQEIYQSLGHRGTSH